MLDNLFLKIAAVSIGVLPFFRPWKRKILGGTYNSDSLSPLEKKLHIYLLVYWERYEYLYEKDLEKREAMKAILMGGAAGRAWAGHYQSFSIDLDRPAGEITFGEAYPIFAALETIIRERKDAGRLAVVQVGCSSGREIAFYAAKFPEVDFIGTDIYDDVVEYAAGFHHLENLSFAKAAAGNMDGLLASLRHDHIIVFTSGCLTYVFPEHVDILFRSLAACEAPVTVAVQEPAFVDARGHAGALPSKWIGNMGYSHNYEAYAERCGLDVTRLVMPEPRKSDPQRRHIAHYFMVAHSMPVAAPAIQQPGPVDLAGH